MEKRAAACYWRIMVCASCYILLTPVWTCSYEWVITGRQIPRLYHAVELHLVRRGVLLRQHWHDHLHWLWLSRGDFLQRGRHRLHQLSGGILHGHDGVRELQRVWRGHLLEFGEWRARQHLLRRLHGGAVPGRCGAVVVRRLPSGLVFEQLRFRCLLRLQRGEVLDLRLIFEHLSEHKAAALALAH